MKNSIILLLAGIGLMGCTSIAPNNTDMAKQTLMNSDACCTNIASFPWIELQKEEALKFNIDESSPIWTFNGHKAYFSAFKFAQQSGMVKIKVRSNMLDKRVLAPQIALYDASFNLIKTIKKDDFKIKFSDAFAPNRYEIELKINSVQTPFIVFYGDSQNIGEKVVVPHPAKIRAEESGEPLPIVTDPLFYISPTGSLTLSVETLTLTSHKTNVTTSTTAPTQTTTSIKATSTTRDFYYTAIQQAVKDNHINKALALLDEAKALNIQGAQEIFVKAINKQQ